MEFTNEMIKKAQKAASAEELIQIAKADGVSLSAEDAEKYFSFLLKSKELTENELEAVSGGELERRPKDKPEDAPDPKFSANQTLWIADYAVMKYHKILVLGAAFYVDALGWGYNIQEESGNVTICYLEDLERNNRIYTSDPGEWPIK